MAGTSLIQEQPGVWRLGDVTITKIPELTLADMSLHTLLPEFEPGTLADHPDWAAPETLDPATGNVLLSLHSWLVQTPRHTILIDTGAGNDKLRPALPALHRLQTPFLDRLAAAGVAPGAVDYVLITHLHADHVGWNTRLVEGRWVPTFPNARYVFSELEQQYGAGLAYSDERAAAALARAGLTHPVRTPVAGVYADSIQPVLDAGQAQLISIDADEFIEDIHFHPLPGHSLDHAVITLHSRGAEAVFGGDSLHHPVEIYEPDLVSCFCEFPDTARASRQCLLEHLAESGAPYFSGHFPASSVGRVTRQKWHYAWEFL